MLGPDEKTKVAVAASGRVQAAGNTSPSARPQKQIWPSESASATQRQRNSGGGVHHRGTAASRSCSANIRVGLDATGNGLHGQRVRALPCSTRARGLRAGHDPRWLARGRRQSQCGKLCRSHPTSRPRAPTGPQRRRWPAMLLLPPVASSFRPHQRFRQKDWTLPQRITALHSCPASCGRCLHGSSAQRMRTTIEANQAVVGLFMRAHEQKNPGRAES